MVKNTMTETVPSSGRGGTAAVQKGKVGEDTHIILSASFLINNLA